MVEQREVGTATGRDSAELGPGDAIDIPPLWWHNVESLAPCNLLVNYWWHAGSDGRGVTHSAFDSLVQAIVSLRDLPAPSREAWQALFEHYVFGPQDAVNAYIPPSRRGPLGSLAPADFARGRAFLAARLAPPAR